MSGLSYTIKEVAKLSGLPESTLRYYETIGLIDAIERDTSSKHRVYTESDVNLIVAIACLSATGMSLDDMRSYLSNRLRGADGADEQVRLLEAQQLRISDEAVRLATRREYVDLKIEYWHAVAQGDDKTAQSIATRAKVIAERLHLPKE